MKKLLYFGYFIKKTNYRDLVRSFRAVKKNTQLSYFEIFVDMVMSSFKYQSSFHDYFMFEFYKKNHKERDSYLTTGSSYEFYTKLNDAKRIFCFRNKTKFNELFQDFIKRDFLFLKNCTISKFMKWMENKEYIIAKPNEGVAGRGIEKICVKNYNLHELYLYLKKKKLELIEDFIKQHDKMNKMNPSSVNTIRIITVRWRGYTDIIAAILRIGVDKHVDNFSAGGIAAPIDILTGEVSGPAISKKELITYEYHPETKCRIKGFKIPYWDEAVRIAREASKIVPEVKTVGWDIAITKNGAELIEGNDNWGKDAFQLLYGHGRKYVLDKYIID